MTREQPLSRPSHGAEPAQPARFRMEADVIVAIVLVIFAIAVYGVTTTFEEVPRSLAQGVQPATYPRLLVAVLVALSVILFLQARAKVSRPVGLIPRKVVQTAILVVAACLAIPYLGIVAIMMVTCASIPPLWGERRHLVTAAFAILFPLSVYGLFHGVLEVQFPLGIFHNAF